MNTIALTRLQVAFELRSFMRNRAGRMFTFLFPIMFLVVFGLGSDSRTAQFQGGNIPFIQFFVGGIIAYGLIGATYTSLAMRVVTLRESGVLKRVRGTPLPPLAYLGGQIGASLIIGAILSAITLVAAVVLYDAHTYMHTAAALITTLAVGAMSFCAIGLAVSSFVPNADAAPAIINFTFLPIAFISDIFYSLEDGPSWLKSIASLFPVKHLANALQVAFDPRTSGTGFRWTDLAIVALWGVGATLFCVRKFKWESTK